jgi:predicted lipoprotein with Yx(FWY)xxD motif
MGSISQRVLRSRKLTVGLVVTALFAVLAGTATAGLVSSLTVANRTVAGKPGTIVVDRRGDTIYELSGESLSHLQCVTWQCLKQFPPVEVRGYGVRVPVFRGVPGRVTIMRRVRANLYQAMLDNHPLYYYSGDTKIGYTKGQGVKGPGGVWHVIKAS